MSIARLGVHHVSRVPKVYVRRDYRDFSLLGRRLSSALDARASIRRFYYEIFTFKFVFLRVFLV